MVRSTPIQSASKSFRYDVPSHSPIRPGRQFPAIPESHRTFVVSLFVLLVSRQMPVGIVKSKPPLLKSRILRSILYKPIQPSDSRCEKSTTATRCFQRGRNAKLDLTLDSLVARNISEGTIESPVPCINSSDSSTISWPSSLHHVCLVKGGSCRLAW